MHTHRVTDYRFDLDYEWQAEVLCQIVTSLWRQMQTAGLIAPTYHLRMPTTAAQTNELIEVLQHVQDELNMGIPQRLRLPTFVFARVPDGSHVLGIELILKTLTAAWTGLGQRPNPGTYSPHGWSQRSNDLIWFLQHYDKLDEMLSSRVELESFPHLLTVALSEICWPWGGRLLG